MKTFIVTLLVFSLSASELEDLSSKMGKSLCHEHISSSADQKLPPPPDLFRENAQIFSAHGEFLFWRMQEGALQYAQKMTQSAWGPADCFAQGKYEKATFNGDPGFRLALVYFRAPHYWEFWTQYTRFTTRGSNAAGKPSPDGDYLTGTWPQIFDTPMAKAESHIHVNYNLADLIITRVFFPNPHLRLRVLGGGSASWIDQFWKVLYRDSSGLETKMGNRWRFVGGGLRVGTVFDWYWTWDLYMTGVQTFAGFLGSYHNRSKQITNYQPDPTYNPGIPVRNAHYSDIRTVFETQFALGPSYQKNLDDSRFELFVGWELTSWFNLQEIYRSTEGTPSEAKQPWINTGMIALQGLTLRAIYDF